MKKIFVLLTLVVALAIGCLTGCQLGTTDPKDNAASVVTIDVNPGIRVYLASDDTVIEVEATNEDGDAIVAEVKASIKGEALDTAVDTIVDEMFDRGFLSDESNSVLVSLEKEAEGISEKLNEKIKKSFEKHGKVAGIISQRVHELKDEVKASIEDIAEKYDISEGKAHVIEKIREEFPELDEKELAELKMNDLALMLEGVSDEAKEQFDRIGKIAEDMYVGAEAALSAVISDAEIALDDIVFKKIHISREDGKMVYEVEIVTKTMEYEYEIDAATGEILEKESEESELPDVDGKIDEFFDKHGDKINIGGIPLDKDTVMDIINGAISGAGKPEQGGEESKPLSRGEILKAVLSALGITEENIEDTSVRMLKGDEGKLLVTVSIELKSGDKYRVSVEGYTGAIIEAELNGVNINLELTE